MQAITTHRVNARFVDSRAREYGRYGIEAFLEPRAILG
jgi:hypothetical protein